MELISNLISTIVGALIGLLGSIFVFSYKLKIEYRSKIRYYYFLLKDNTVRLLPFEYANIYSSLEAYLSFFPKNKTKLKNLYKLDFKEKDILKFIEDNNILKDLIFQNPDTNIYVLGTEHSTKKSKDKISEILKNYNFDLILLEGINEDMSIKNLRYFYFLPSIRLFFRFLDKKGSEFDEIKISSKKNGIYYKNIDINISELCKYFHKWYNYIIFFGLLFFLIIILYFYFFYVINSYHILSIIVYILIILFYIIIFPIIWFALFTKKIRDEEFQKNIKNIIRNGSNKNVFVACGKKHIKPIKERFSNVIDLNN